MFEYSTSGFYTSVGTGLALEAIFKPIEEVIDPSRDVYQEVEYNALYVNVYTLIRNIIQSAKDYPLKRKYKKDIKEALDKELATIKRLADMEEKEFVAFAPDYDELKYNFHFRKTMSNSRKVFEFSKSIAKEYKTDYIIEDKGVLLLTHIAMDLLNNVTLLESNTGNILDRSSFNKKYNGSFDYSFLPFTYEILYVLGDKGRLLITAPVKIKKALIKALEGRVNPKTSPKKIRALLLKDALVSDYIRLVRSPYEKGLLKWLI